MDFQYQSNLFKIRSFVCRDVFPRPSSNLKRLGSSGRNGKTRRHTVVYNRLNFLLDKTNYNIDDRKFFFSLKKSNLFPIKYALMFLGTNIYEEVPFTFWNEMELYYYHQRVSARVAS